jgi:translation initiation factor 6
LLRKIDIENNPYIGVFCRANEKFLLAPHNAHQTALARISEALGVELIIFSVGGCTLIGSLVCSNSHGALLSNIANNSETRQLGAIIPAEVLNDRLNALGNNILANDFGAVVNPDYGKKSIEQIGNALGVKAVGGTVAALKTVGATAIATNKGVLCHPHTTDKEIALLRETLGVPVSIGTLNYGTPMIGACILANSRGAVVGTPTTTVEIGRVQDALEL